MEVQKIAAARLNPAAYNPRKELKPGSRDYEKLKRSIEEFGFVEPIVWNKASGNVVSGHQRLRVLLDLGHTEIDCVVVDLDPLREKALNLALNRIQGDWDEGKLAAIMADLDAADFDVSYTGFDADEIDALMNKFYSKEAEQDDFDVGKAKSGIEAAGQTRTQPGDLWQLGGHCLLCGDPASGADVARLLDGKRAACAVTELPCELDPKAGLAPWTERMQAVLEQVCRFADVACCTFTDLFATGSQFMEPLAAYCVKLFSDRNFRPLWMRVWKKNGIAARMGTAHLSSAKPMQQFSYVSAFTGQAQEAYNDQEFAWVSAFAGHSYQFVRRLTRDERRNWGYAAIWEMAPISTGDGKKAASPVELPWRCMKLHSDPGAVVYDPFCGCGTTLIAAEQSGRLCCAMDPDPVNCDLSLLRWEQYTGEKAVKL